MKIIIYSERKSFIKNKGRAYQTVLGQEDALLRYGEENVSIVFKSLIIKTINKILNMIKIRNVHEGFLRTAKPDTLYLFIAMNLVDIENNKNVLTYIKKMNKLILYIYDCWEPDFEKWEHLLKKINPDYVFFAYKQSKEYFESKFKNCYYIPQCVDIDFYKVVNNKKTRLFMQMGRLNPIIHKNINKYLKTHNIVNTKENYVYPKEKRQSIFESFEELIKEIGKTKYFVCVPKNLENPKRTGNVSDLTARYFEAIACKTLIIGKKPITFDELFPLDSMIELNDDYNDFEEKVEKYENDRNAYDNLVNKNYEYLINNHTWKNRLDLMLKIVNREES